MNLSFNDPQFLSFIPAEPKHRQALIDFLGNVRNPGDYNRFLVDNLLNSADNLKVSHFNTLVLLWDKIIASIHGLLFPGHYYWGGGLTIDPRFRNLGLDRRLIEMNEGVASKYNAKEIKTATSPRNVRVFKKWGFSKTGQWHILGYRCGEIKPAASKSSGVRQAADSDLEGLEKFLSGSTYYTSCDRMYAEDLTWYPLDRPWLSDFIKQEKVLLNENDSGIRGFAIINKKSLINPFIDGSFSIMEIGYFDGDWAAILDFIRENYHPDFLRIYSAEGIPLKNLPAEIKNGWQSKFDGLFGGLRSLEISPEKLFFTTVMIMRK